MLINWDQLKLNSIGKPYRPVQLQTQARYLTSNTEHILSAFSEFLSSLFTKPGPFSLQQSEQLFQKRNLPSLPGGACKALNANISEAKDLQAFKPLKPSKAPGPNGFSGLYYMSFSALLSPHLANYFNALKHSSLPSPDALRDHTSMVLKKPDDSCEPQAFQPISIPEQGPENSG